MIFNEYVKVIKPYELTYMFIIKIETICCVFSFYSVLFFITEKYFFTIILLRKHYIIILKLIYVFLKLNSINLLTFIKVSKSK